MKKVLLIQPPIHDFYFTFPRNYPLGLLYLGTVLKKEGFKVKILNALEEKKKITLKIPPQFSYLKRYYHPNLSPFKLFDNFYHFGMEWEKIEEIIKKENPQIIGISSNFSCYFDTTSFLANLIKKIDKRIIVVVGGHFPTHAPSLVLKDKNIDFVIRGEAEFSFLKFCKNIDKSLKNIEGLCYRTKKGIHLGEVALISNLDELPNPDRSLINCAAYKFKGKVFASLIASRGCIFRCKFCAIKTPFRKRKVENILSEIKEAYMLGIRHFNFEDDNINLHPEFERLLDLLLENFIEKGKKIYISFMNGVMGGFSKNILEKLIECGLTHLDLSLVTAKKELRRKIERKEKKRDIFYVASYLSKRRIPVYVHFIIGLPQQKFKDALKDIIYLSKKNVFLGPSIFYPVIESKLFSELKEKYGIREEDFIYFRSSCAYFDKDIPRDYIFFLFYLSRIINFIKEVMNRFNFDGKEFFSWLEKIVEKYKFEKGSFIASKKFDKFTIGAILLKELVEKKKIYRILMRNGYEYKLEKEDFIPEKELEKIIRKGILINTLLQNFKKIKNSVIL